MSDTINIGVLVAARDEYSEVLKSNLAPLIIQGFNSIYNDSLKMTGGKHTLKQFQLLPPRNYWLESVNFIPRM